MGSKKKLNGETVCKYLLDARYAHLPSKSLAKIIYNENVALFASAESVRSMIRYYRGQKGESEREGLISPVEQKEKGFYAKELGIPNPFGLPDSDEVEWEPFEIARSIKRLGVLSDVHIPYHNVGALTSALEHLKSVGVDGILLNGDIMDFYMLSRFDKDPRRRSFSSELEMGRGFLKVLRNEFEGVPIYYKLGNHEIRFESYMRTKAPELLGMPEYQIDMLLRFGEHGIVLIQDDRIIKAGRLSILHGHEFGRSVFSPVNPARGAYMRAKENVLVGHNHQTSSHMEKSLNGDVIGAWSTGCLCEMQPSYLRINKWNHGFAVVDIEHDGTFEVNNHTIIKGKVR